MALGDDPMTPDHLARHTEAVARALLSIEGSWNDHEWEQLPPTVQQLFCEQARAAIAAMLPVWQPIETAPHNTRILLAWQDWCDGSWSYEAGPYSTGERLPNGYSNVSCHGSATHWQPLPTPPENNNDH